MLKKIFLSLLVGLFFAGKVLAQGVDYYLPYPGILPDHPLYWLKMVRDRVDLLATTNTNAKAEKLLLYADKRLGAAWALIDGNKPALGVSTLTKGEKYLEQAVVAGGDAAFKDKLGKAILKHDEVIKRLKGQMDSTYAPTLDEMLLKLNQYKQQYPAAVLKQVTVKVSFDAKNTASQTVEATTALDALEKIAQQNNWAVITKDFDFGKMVTAVGDQAGTAAKAWIYYVNGQAGDKGADQFNLNAGDQVEWRYEAVKP